MKNKSTILLAYRLSEINKEIDNLQIEYNMIVEELKSRHPKLKDDENLQPKVRRRIKDEG